MGFGGVAMKVNYKDSAGHVSISHSGVFVPVPRCGDVVEVQGIEFDVAEVRWLPEEETEMEIRVLPKKR